MSVDPRWKTLRDEGAFAELDMVIDIEAIIDPDCPPPPPPEGETVFPAPAHWRVVTIGAAWIVGGVVKKIGVIGAGIEEPEKLRAFVDIFDARAPRVIGWNTRGFDLPVIAHRCMRHGIAWPWYYNETRGKNPRYRYADDCQLDLMDALCDRGSSRRMTLDSAARLIGLPGKMGTSGADVAKLHATGQLLAIDRYCMEDVAQTVAVYLRFELLRGVVSFEEYRRAITSWAEVVGATPGLSRVLSESDMGRITLEAKR